ncbi:MAG: DEAD/DEAH box helicase, partial [Clostridia bacterium]|nr:DEAD/DEAH box helicase [Clostridia bacterium]
KYILHQKKVLLGDEMGLGKTIQAIAAMVSLRNSGATHFLVVCPASVLSNWRREIAKHSDLNAIKIHGDDRNAQLKLWLKEGGVGITTYETTAFFKLEETFSYSMLVVDEAHYIKNPETKRSINTKKLCKRAERILFMTGTALENDVDEMINLISILQPALTSQIQGFAFMSSAPQFRLKIAPVYYRRKREDVLTELPELIQSEEWCEMNSEEEELYENAVLEKKYVEARRVSWNVPDLKNSSKANRLLEIVEEAEKDNRKVIVFSFFLDTIRKIYMLLGDKCLNPINGSVPPQRRQEILDEFDASPAGSVLLAQIQSGGTGLNIQAASVVVICEPQFKPSTENQAISRAYRMGQSRNVLVYRLLCEDSVDEKITDTLEQKQAIFDAFADKSVSAEQSLEIDDNSFGDIMEKEIARINEKRGLSRPNAPKTAEE